MSKLKLTRGSLSQEQKQFLIENKDLSLSKLQRSFAKKFNRRMSVRNMTNFYRRLEPVRKESLDKVSISISKHKQWSMDDNKFIVIDAKDNKVEINLDVFTKEFVKNLCAFKKQAEERKFNESIEFWNKL
jgi:hypothetical protein